MRVRFIIKVPKEVSVVMIKTGIERFLRRTFLKILFGFILMSLIFGSITEAALTITVSRKYNASLAIIQYYALQVLKENNITLSDTTGDQNQITIYAEQSIKEVSLGENVTLELQKTDTNTTLVTISSRPKIPIPMKGMKNSCLTVLDGISSKLAANPNPDLSKVEPLVATNADDGNNGNSNTDGNVDNNKVDNNVNTDNNNTDNSNTNNNNNRNKNDQPSDMDSKLDTLANDLAAKITGNMAEKEVIRVAIMQFPDLKNNFTDLGAYISEELLTRFSNFKKFEIIERQRLDQVVKEHKFNTSGLVDPNTVVDLGKILGVQAIITGSISDLGDCVKINSRFIVIETGVSRAGKGVEIKKDNRINKLLGEK
jgi:TolB-like protein